MSDGKTSEKKSDGMKAEAEKDITAEAVSEEKPETSAAASGGEGEAGDSGKGPQGSDKPEEAGQKPNGDEKKDLTEELEQEAAKKDQQLREYVELARRIKAEFDNYRKRTAKEKEQLYGNMKGEIMVKFLPVLDNLERAVSQTSESSDLGSVIDGMNMILKQFRDILAKEGVEEIEADGRNFDPNLHDAVMHIEDESVGKNTIVGVFQKGYRLNDKILRHSMVKVAN